MRFDTKRWNQGDVSKNPFAMRRERRSHELVLGEPPDRAFDRTCQTGLPVWLPRGASRPLYSDSGRDERDALWHDARTGPALFGRPDLPTLWSTLRIDKSTQTYRAALIHPGLSVGTLDMRFKAHGGGATVRLDLTCTAISKVGAELFAEGIGDRMTEMLAQLGHRIAHRKTADQVPAEPASHSQRRVRTHRREIATRDIDRVFGLACPVAELRWIDGWSFDLIYSESGRNEPGCVFLEPSSGLAILGTPGAGTYWFTTCYDTEEHRFEAVWITKELTVGKFELVIAYLDQERVQADWRLTYTGASPEGDRLICEPGFESRMDNALGFLASSLKTYVETNTMLRVAPWRKLHLAASLVGSALGRHLRRRRRGSTPELVPGENGPCG